MNRKRILILIIILTITIILLTIKLKPSTRYNKISISEDKWNSIISSRDENKNLILKDIEFNDYNLIIDEEDSKLYYSLINENKTKYNPSVSFKIDDNSAKIVTLADEITDEKIESSHQFKLMIYNDKEYHIYNLICTKLPILNISYEEEDKDKHKSIPIEVYLFNNLSDSTNRILISNGKLKTNEESYIFSLHMTTPGKNIRENPISVLNMKPSKEYILNKENGEKSEFKNGKNYVELFINNKYIGLYSIENVAKEKKNPLVPNSK